MKELSSPEAREKILNAIKQAELDTSGELRVHICRKLKGDIFDEARKTFEKLGMTATAEKNGVLVFIAPAEKQFAILGDSGINELVPEGFWDSTRDLMLEHFKNGEFAEGVEAGLLNAGKMLKKYFPHKKDDENELSDEISFD